jgi:hypothetical protein
MVTRVKMAENPNTWKPVQHCICDRLINGTPQEQARAILTGLVGHGYLTIDNQDEAFKRIVRTLIFESETDIVGYSIPTSIYYALESLLLP